jgi:hypothetical protein
MRPRQPPRRAKIRRGQMDGNYGGDRNDRR